MSVQIGTGAIAGRLAGLVALMALGAAGGASAQDAHRGPPPPPSSAAPMAMRQHEADDIALVLRLRADQRPALNAFVESWGPPAPPPGPPPRPTMSENDFPGDLARMEQRAAQRAVEDRERFASARAFYARLELPQKAAFDALMRLRQAPGGPGRGPMDGPPPPR